MQWHNLTFILSWFIVYKAVPGLVTSSRTTTLLSASNNSHFDPVNWNATQPQTFAQWRKQSTWLDAFIERIVCPKMATLSVNMLYMYSSCVACWLSSAFIESERRRVPHMTNNRDPMLEAIFGWKKEESLVNSTIKLIWIFNWRKRFYGLESVNQGRL